MRSLPSESASRFPVLLVSEWLPFLLPFPGSSGRFGLVRLQKHISNLAVKKPLHGLQCSLPSKSLAVNSFVPTSCSRVKLAPKTNHSLLPCRFEAHTKHCPSCSAAYNNTVLVQKIAGALCAALFVAAITSLTVHGLLAKPTIIAALGAVVSGAAVAASSHLIKLFTFVDYSHAEKHSSKG